jgi:peroxiredoxin
MPTFRLSPRAALALAAVALFTVWIGWRAKALELHGRHTGEVSQLTGKPAPDFDLESLDGRRVSLASYRGKTVAVTFWASWCGPCRMELPALARFYRQTHKPGSDFEILAISIDSTREAAQGAANTLQVPFPVLLDLDSRLADAYHVDSIPTLFVVGNSGEVVWSNTGFSMTLEIMLAQQLGIQNYNPAVGVSK